MVILGTKIQDILEIDPIASEVVKDVYKLYTKNYGIRPITKKIEEDNRYLKS